MCIRDRIDTATGGKLSVIKNKVSDAFSSIKKTAGSIMQAAKDTISDKLSNIKSAYEEHGGGIKGCLLYTSLSRVKQERLERLKNRLNLYYEAEEAVLLNQEYVIGTKSLKRADL